MISPIEIFREYWEQARSLGDASAAYCTLATVSEDGQVSTRTLVLREVTDDSFVIFINNTSPKWKQLDHSNHIEVLVFWPSLMQQYRIRGQLESIPKEKMRLHWANKPYDAKIIDNYYKDYQPESSVLDSKDTLLAGINNLKNSYPKDADVPFPSNVGGVRIKANYIESWQGSNADRLHERHLYELSGNQWERTTLVP
ncbi:MAG: pyridoxine/pyridoxamine 5'-phosphate oxidase [Methylophagaceae bacterium]|jgi:pyridoxine/pyridoxamine 5'-phosphate oxidase